MQQGARSVTPWWCMINEMSPGATVTRMHLLGFTYSQMERYEGSRNPIGRSWIYEREMELSKMQQQHCASRAGRSAAGVSQQVSAYINNL